MTNIHSARCMTLTLNQPSRTAMAMAVLLLSSAASFAQECHQDTGSLPADCEHANAGLTVTVPAGESTERVSSQAEGNFGPLGFSISVDNAPVAGGPVPRVPERDQDRALARANVDVRFDSLETIRLLNIVTTDQRNTFRPGEEIRFRTSTNYPAYITRTEIRVLEEGRFGRRVVATVPTVPNGETRWQMPTDGSDRLSYVVRVYDAKGRFDETKPLPLLRSDLAGPQEVQPPFAAPGEGEDRTRLRNIPVPGGTITVSGRGGPPGGSVIVMGERVPVDAQGHFVVSRVLPVGDQVVQVRANGQTLVRDVFIPASDWFYVGLANATIGTRRGIPGEGREVYVDGRLAYYIDGRTQSGWRVTSSLDTGDGPIEDIFRRLNDKDPRRVIDRLREDDNPVYPTYGDESTLVDNTPSRGRFYVRAENETTRLTFGDFDVGITGTGLLQNSRSLYGAELRYKSASITERGDSLITAQVYAAQADTAAQRDILRGTGGSIYFLTRQDINGGSAKLTVQTIDNVTGRVISTQQLVEGVDYRLDYFQGVVILTNPLQASTSDGGLITQGSGDYAVNLVASYEFTPPLGALDDAAFGGRVEGWATEDLRLGATIMDEETSAGDRRVSAVDLRYQLGEGSFIEIESARSSGPGLTRSDSVDGGLVITSTGGAPSGSANALRFGAQLDLADLNSPWDGTVGLYYLSRDAGFATLNEEITEDRESIGVEANVKVTERLDIGLTAERTEKSGVSKETTAEVRLGYQLRPMWRVDLGVERTDTTDIIISANTGERTDAAAKLTFSVNADTSIYIFGQQTLSQSGGIEENDRLGFGGRARLTEKLSVSGEFSDGDTGEAAEVQLRYAPTADNEVYLGYTLDPTRHGSGSELAGSDRGTVVLGGRYKYSENLTSYTESKLDLPGDQRSLTQAYGVIYTPNTNWTLSSAIETGAITETANDFDRRAYSFGAAYVRDDEVSGRVRLEHRNEEGAGLFRDRDTYAFSSSLSYKLNPDWRLLADVDVLRSISAQTDFRNGKYISASLGYAYRPVENERLNLLLGYTYLRDLSGEDQVTADGTTDGPEQISHVFSLASNYDLNDTFTLGGKLGYRVSEIAPRGTDTFADNEAALLIGRLDWHIVHKWDAFVEGRYTTDLTNDASETGALAGVYRHVGDNAKIGIGVEWGEVSDDLTSLNYDSSGVFIDLVGKF